MAKQFYTTVKVKVGNTNPRTRVSTSYEGRRYILEPDERYELPEKLARDLANRKLIEEYKGPHEAIRVGKADVGPSEGTVPVPPAVAEAR